MDTRVTALRGAPIFLDDTPSLSVFELRSKARKLKREHDIQLIIIDYLQLMNASGMNFGSREQEVSIISRNLKALAKELDIDMVLFIHRPEYFRIYTDTNGNDLRGMAKIIIAKHRNGAIGDITLRFRAQYAKFQNVDDTEEPLDALPYTQPANNSSSDGIRIQGRLDDSARISDDEPAPF